MESLIASHSCANCGERPGTVRWGNALAVTHGFVQMWCEVCVLTKQIEHAEERAAALRELRARLAILTGNPSSESGDWERTPHAFMEKAAKREGDLGWDGDPESCALCWLTPGHPIHTDTGRAERYRLGLLDGWRP